MITIRPAGDVFAPVVVCDVCRQEIKDGAGNVEWQTDEHGEMVGEIHHTHKRCSRQLQGMVAARPGASWAWEDLDLFLAYLAGNAGVDWTQAERHAKELAETGMARYEPVRGGKKRER